MSYVIYKITNLDDGKCYIGSTIRKMRDRLYEHKSRSKKGVNKCECRYFNWDNIHVEEVEIPDIVIDDICVREAYVIKNTKNCINKTLPFITEEERKEKGKQYREINKERIRETKKRYRENNKERIREKNRERITCECGSHINRNEFSRHKKTQKHKNYF